MSGRFAASNKVAIVGYAHSQVLRHADRTLGVQAVETARAAIADAGLHLEQIDGFVSSSLLPSAGGQAAEDGVSTVSSAWLAQHLGAEPRYVAGFDGIGQITGSVGIAVNAVASGAADYVLFTAPCITPAEYHANPMRQAHGPMQWTAPQGFGPLAMIALPYNEYLQRFGARRESMAAVVVEARKNGARIPWSFWHDRPLTQTNTCRRQCFSTRSAVTTATSRSTGVAAFVFTSAERAKDLPHRRCTSPVRRRHACPAAVFRCTGRSTTSSTEVRRRLGGCGRTRASRRRRSIYRRCTTASRRLCGCGWRCSGFCRPGEAHRFVESGGIDSDRPDALPALSGGGALGNGRMHGIPQMLECYLQLARRAGDRQRDHATIGLAWPLLAAFRRRGRLQRGGILRVVFWDLSEYRSTVTGL